MDQSKMTFLQNVLRYSASHSDGTNQSQSDIREMSPEVFINFIFIFYLSIYLNKILTFSVKNGLKTR